MQDTYPIGTNMSFSVEWHTPCTPDFGDCGCDNCIGEFEDISARMDEFAQRLHILGEERTKTVWAVPQAFGGSEWVTDDLLLIPRTEIRVDTGHERQLVMNG